MLEFRTDANNFFDNLHRIRVLSIETRNVGIGLTSLNHHHTKVVAFEHLIVRLLDSIALTLSFLCQYAGIAFTTLLLRRMAQVDNLDAIDTQVELGCQFGDVLVVAQEHRLTNTLSLSLHGSL